MASRMRRRPEARSTFSGVRRHSRRSVDFEVYVQDSQGWEFPLEAADISPSGIFVRSDLLFEVGSEHVLVFRPPGTETTCRIPARVVRLEEGETARRVDCSPGMAYEFLSVSDRTRDLLERAVARGAVDWRTDDA
ncbi:MAG: PilZ domain-containing protein, partial [Bradymonadaceae bacterium]